MRVPRTAAILVLWGGLASCAAAQSVRGLVNEGNDLYDRQQYGDAEVQYRKALEKERALLQGQFNLGNSLYKQEKFDESVHQFESSAELAKNPQHKAAAFYNGANALLQEEKYQEAIRSYIESLKLNPGDMDAKYNLSYALQKLREQQQNKDKKDQSKDKQDKQDQQQKQEQDKNKGEQNEKQNQEQQRQQQDQQQAEQREQQQARTQEKLMSQADAERILEVLENSEREVQKKLRVRQGAKTKTEKDW